MAEGNVSSDLQVVLQALDRGDLNAQMNKVDEQFRSVAASGQWTDKSGKVLRASPEVIAMTAGLLKDGAKMSLMSLFRYGNGPHGEKQADGSAISRAIDIIEYLGHPINLKTPAAAEQCIQGVAMVIQYLPPGRYSVGLPRPGGGDKIDPPNDVFFPVTAKEQVDVMPGGSPSKAIDMIREPARTAIKAAMAANPEAKLVIVFPDAVDHLHIKALAPGARS